MPTAAAERKAALTLFAILSLLWGYNWVVMKLGLQYSGPFTFTALRSVAAAAFLFAVMIATGRSLRPVALPETLLFGMLQTFGFLGLAQFALVLGGAGKTAVLVYSMPFWTILLAWPLLGERLRPLQWLAVALAAGGMLLILQPWNLRSGALSNLLALGAGLSWAASVIVAKRLRAHHQVDLMSLTTWQLALGSIPLILLAWLADEPPVRWGMDFALVLFYSGVLSNAIGWLMWLYALHRLPAGTASLNTLAIPVVAVLAAWMQFGERPGIAEGSGMLVVAGGLVLMSVVTMREAKRIERLLARK